MGTLHGWNFRVLIQVLYQLSYRAITLPWKCTSLYAHGLVKKFFRHRGKFLPFPNVKRLLYVLWWNIIPHKPEVVWACDEKGGWTCQSSSSRDEGRRGESQRQANKMPVRLRRRRLEGEELGRGYWCKKQEKVEKSGHECQPHLSAKRQRERRYHTNQTISLSGIEIPRKQNCTGVLRNKNQDSSWFRL